MKITVTRAELCNLMLACTTADYVSNENTSKWKDLHAFLEQQLKEYDESQVKKQEAKEELKIIKEKIRYMEVKR